MRCRSHYLLSILLLVALVGCSNKPSDTPASSSAASPASSAPADGNTSSSSAARPADKITEQSKVAEQPTVPGAPPTVPRQPSTVTLPEGTTITVRLGETLGSKVSSPGQSFTATVAQPVTHNGETVIASGANARGTVVEAKPLGRFKGGAVLQVRLTSVTVDHTEQAVETSAVGHSLKGKGKRTAVMAGGGTAVGALIGGLAGGGKGAAIGAIAGAGAGGAGAAFTGNKDIVLPAESAITFKLTAPLQVKPVK